jgi:hypothetical protein
VFSGLRRQPGVPFSPANAVESEDSARFAGEQF